jgi:hypothetical protein
MSALLQPNASYSETTEDSGDGFGHGTGGVHDNEHTSLQTDDDSGSQDMDEDNPLYDVFYRRPVGYCLNCTQTLYSTACSACGHDSRSNDDLFSTARGLQPEPSTSAPSSPEALIVWDEQMLLHEEGESAPHPERYCCHLDCAAAYQLSLSLTTHSFPGPTDCER